MPECASCNAPIFWVVMSSSRRMPVDVDPVPNGNVVLTGVADETGAPRARTLTQREIDQPTLGDPEDRYLSHFVTCPESKIWRKRKGKK